MADVVDQPDRDAARCRGLDRPAHELRGLGPQVKVVLRKIERPLGLPQEGRDLLRHVDGLLTAVRERSDLDRAAQRTLARPPNWRHRPEWKRSIRVRSTG